MSTAQDEIDAEELAFQDDPKQNIRNWLLATPDATLCTLSAKTDLAGYPFGSLVPFALDRDGRPFVLIADIAAHTANLRKDPRGSLLVRKKNPKGDAQASWRITVMGRWQRLGESADAQAQQELSTVEIDELWARYEAAVPAAREYRRTHSFAFWRMQDVEKVRYIAGFGKICWLVGSSVKPNPVASDFGQKALLHMNEDHVDSMLEMCRGMYNVEPVSIQMTELTSTGFFLDATLSNENKRFWFPFYDEVSEKELRGKIIAVLHSARSLAIERDSVFV